MNSTALSLTSVGHTLDLSPECFGELRNSSDLLDDVAGLRTRMADDGYLLLRGLLHRDEVLAARRAITDRLAQEGFLHPDYPTIEAVARENLKLSFKPEIAQNLGELHKVLYQGAMTDFFEFFLGGAIRHFDFTWLRTVAPGPGTQPHCDIVYMGRGTKNLYTTWTPLGDVSLEMGGLLVLENSHRKSDIIRRYLEHDVDTYCEDHPETDRAEELGKAFRQGWLTTNPVSLREKLGGRWLTAEFSAGDVIVFGMHFVHGSLDNQSRQLRISSDSRYQLASEPADERWIGVNPPGHGLAGKRGRIC